MTEETGRVVRFPQSRVPGTTKNPPAKIVGITPLARQMEVAGHRAGAHWCSRRQGVWYGLILEAECPVCGNGHG